MTTGDVRDITITLALLFLILMLCFALDYVHARLPQPSAPILESSGVRR